MLYRVLELPRKTYGSALFHHLKIFRDLDLTRCRLLAVCPFADTNGQDFEEVQRLPHRLETHLGRYKVNLSSTNSTLCAQPCYCQTVETHSR